MSLTNSYNIIMAKFKFGRPNYFPWPSVINPNALELTFVKTVTLDTK